MVGIYKITNKINGKSYIGQSIHCGRRLDEHCKGNQLIDEIIQLEGVENFTFEILKEVLKEELSYWEDYFIIKYQTFFPKGYNKKWNCNSKVKKEIKKQIENEIFQEKQIDNGNNGFSIGIPIPNTEEGFFLKSKNCNERIYVYLLLKSKRHSNSKETYRYVEKMTQQKIANDLGINRNTVSTRLKDLVKYGYIIPDGKYYRIPKTDHYTLIPEMVLHFLLNHVKGDEKLIKLYIVLFDYFNTEKSFSIVDLHKELGYALSKDGKPISKNSDYIRTLLTILSEAGLVKYDIRGGRNEKGAFIDIYTILSMYSNINEEYCKS